MADVTNELMYELLKRMNHRLEAVEDGVADLKREFNSMCGVMVSMQGDLHNIYGILDRQDQRLERIEKRLDLHELAEPNRPFDPES